MAHIQNDALISTGGVIHQLKGKHMLYLSEYSAGSVYNRTNSLTRILHLVFIIVMLLLFLARNKILLKHVLASHDCAGLLVHLGNPTHILTHHIHEYQVDI
jgi:hypothetical protein